jgi:hypothetical protein
MDSFLKRNPIKKSFLFNIYAKIKRANHLLNMHSLVIDGWPFYIGLGLFTVHMFLYWLNQWRKSQNKNNNINFATVVLLATLTKRMNRLEEEHEKTREAIMELLEEMDRTKMEDTRLPEMVESSESSLEEAPSDSSSSSSSSGQIRKKIIMVRR